MTVWTGTLPTISSAEEITATDIDTLRDAIGGIADAWTSYTPVWTTTSATPSLGDGTLAGAYARSGKLVFVRLRLVWGSTTSCGAGDWSFSLPAAVGETQIMPGLIYDNGAYSTVVAELTSGDDIFRIQGNNSSGGYRVSATSPMTWASGDWIRLNGAYEAA